MLTATQEKIMNIINTRKILALMAMVIATTAVPTSASARASVHLDLPGISIGLHDRHYGHYDRHYDRHYKQKRKHYRKHKRYKRHYNRHHSDGYYPRRSYRSYDSYDGYRSNGYRNDRHRNDGYSRGGYQDNYCPTPGYSSRYHRNRGCYSHGDHYHCSD
jgi:hypothetical protein